MTRPRGRWVLLGVTTSMLLLVLGGCAPRETVIRDYPPPDTMQTYRELAEKHNDKLRDVDLLWARCRLKVYWTDDEGKPQEDVADDSKIIIDMPDQVAVVVGHSAIGVGMLFWAGCDSERYWIFDLQEDERGLVWGHHRNIGHPRARRLRVPIRPLQLPTLIGLVKLDPDAGGAVDWDRSTGSYIVKPAGRPARLLLDPRTGIPRQIELLDREGTPWMVSQLSKPKMIERRGVLLKDRPWLNRQITIRPADEVHDHLEITIRSVTVDPDEDQLNERQFDLEKLKAHFKPETITQLDEEVESVR